MEIVSAHWDTHKAALSEIRQRVFIEEQHVPSELEWDGYDSEATHFLAMDGSRPIGCIRLLANGYLGRLAVVREYRHRGVAGKLIRYAEHHAEYELKRHVIHASAQAHAYTFYSRLGYQGEGEFFWDADIPHIHIHKVLGKEANEATTQSYLYPNRDNQQHRLTHLVDQLGFILIALSSNPHKVSFLVNDINHLLWRHPQFIDSLSRYLRHLPKFPVRLLIRQDNRNLGHHPLIALYRRTSSLFEIRYKETVNDNAAIFGPWGVVENIGIPHQSAYGYMANKPLVQRVLYQFDEVWNKSKLSTEARQIAL